MLTAITGALRRAAPRAATRLHGGASVLPGRAACGPSEARNGNQPEPRSSLLSAPLLPARFPHAVRAHGTLANCLPRVLDMPMNEARPRPRKQHGPANLALLRRLARNLARRDPAKDALRGNLKRAAWNDDRLLNLIRAAA